jgi:hypothetical protein
MADVTFTPNHQPAPACYPSDVNGMLDLLTTGGGLSGTIPDTAGGGIYVGSSPPSSSLTQKVWFKTDGAGRPLGVYMYYNGNWRKVYTGVAHGTMIMCQYYSGFFDGTGRGIIGGDYDGWAICNGNNGTPNLEGYFPVPGVEGEAVGQPAGVWYTDAEGTGVWKNNGGQKAQVTLAMANLPAMVAHSHIVSGQFGNVGPGYAISTSDAASPDYQLPVTDAGGNKGTSQPLPFPHLYVALGFLMFVGYQ